MRSQQEVIKELREGLEADEADYRKALRLINDPTSALVFLNSLKDRMMPLMSYDPDVQPPHSAVAVVASMKERLGGVFQDLQFISDYEDRKREFKAHVKAHVGIEEESEATSEGPHE